MLKHADELKLKIDSTLQELPLWEVEVELNFFGSDLVKPFKDEPLLPGVVITNNRQYVGMISRRRFFEHMSRPFSLELFLNRPIETFLNIFKIEEEFVISETSSVIEATNLALQRSPEFVYEPIIVKTGSEKYCLLDFQELLLAYSQIHALTLFHLQQAQEETKTPNADVRELQQIDIKLLHREKITALRQIVSSIANEINNPANFIAGKLIHASRYIQQLLQLINLYQQQYPEPTVEIQRVINQVELDNITTDLSKLTDSMKTGIDRIRQFIHALRNFSTEESEKKSVDLHESIDSTLIILQSRLKSKTYGQNITVIKEYAKLPLVECYPGQMNLVLMNIINYVIDAFPAENEPWLIDGEKDKNNYLSPTIRIRTELLNSKTVVIRIANNAVKIPERVGQKIFAPLFNSTSNGKLTELELSISHEIIVEKHGGQLECLPALEQGTEFIIKIPVMSN
ncbi:ATPase [Hapalosiphon sp. MRB220]|nr:ATPase [Hapalosiphon sp. MRB220]